MREDEFNQVLPVPIKNDKLIPHSWTETPTGHWFGRCDVCGHRRIHMDMYEVHGREGPGDTVWWRECSRCLVATLNWFLDLGDELEHQYKASDKESG